MNCMGCGHFLRPIGGVIRPNPPLGMMVVCFDCGCVMQILSTGWVVIEEARVPEKIKTMLKQRNRRNN